MQSGGPVQGFWYMLSAPGLGVVDDAVMPLDVLGRTVCFYPHLLARIIANVFSSALH